MYSERHRALLDYHGRMLGDDARTAGFRAAIAEVVEPGAVVVDLGAGTGILSYFACQAGARHVYAIECGPIVALARELCAANGLEDRVTFVEGMSYDIELPERGDVLITETLWNAGLGEGMLGYVIDARERLLKPDARIVPGSFDVMLAPIEHERLDGIVRDWPTDRYGVDLSPASRYSANTIHQAWLKTEMLLAEPAAALRIDLAAVHDTDAAGTVTFEARRAGVAHGLGGWFEAQLSPGVSLTTRPPLKTSWAHAYMPFEAPLSLAAGDHLETLLQTTADGSIWRWRVRGVGEAREARDQSTFWSWPLTPEQLSKRGPAAQPVLSRRGEAQRRGLERFDGATALGAIEADLHAEFPDVFCSRRASADFVRELALAYG